jgi:hypothetical protein
MQQKPQPKGCGFCFSGGNESTSDAHVRAFRIFLAKCQSGLLKRFCEGSEGKDENDYAP